MRSEDPSGLHMGENAREQEPAWAPLLRMGSVVAAEARAAVRAEAGFRTSGGVACNRALAKLVSGAWCFCLWMCL